MTFWFSWRRKQTSSPVLDWPPPTIIEEPEPSIAQSASPAAAPVHVLAGSALVRIEERVLVVERPDEPRFERPIELVSAVHIHGWAGITSPTISALLAQGTPVVWRGATGYPIGCTTLLHSSGLDTRRSQYRAMESERGLAIARAIVAAKIVNMRGVARRKATLRGREMIDLLVSLAKAARESRDLFSLMGTEGAATARYFATWPDLLSDRAGDIEWQGRSRRPPRDVINAMLSYAYALVAGECLCAAAAAGLDPRAGYLHTARAGRPALALDLMEPFRPLIADQAVLGGLNTGQVKPEHIQEAGEGTGFSDTGRRLVLDLVERRLSTNVTLPDRREPISYRAAIGLQARALAASLRNNEPFTALERP